MGKYDDIINLSRPPSKYPKMSMEQRAAQFAPFAALSGYGDQIVETSRIVDSKMELDEEAKYYLDLKMQILKENILKSPEVSFTYFVKDFTKEGGKYITETGKISKIDNIRNAILLENNIVIPVSDIIDMESEIFQKIF